MQDLRYAVRMLLNKPGFTIIAVLALALGIGANTAIFSVVNAVLLRPLPYRQPDRLVMLWQKLGGATAYPQIPCSAPDYLDYRDQTQTLENVAAFENANFTLTTRTGSERVSGSLVSSNLFPLLGISPLRGRVFTAAEDQFGHDNVIVLSYGAWQRRFGSDPDMLGKTLVLDQKPNQVIGVMPKEFEFPTQGLLSGPTPEFWVPIAFSPDQVGPDGRGDNFNISVITRRKPGVSIQQASADIDRISHRIYESYPPEIRKMFSLDGFVTDFHQQVVGNVKTLLLVLLGAVGFVLLIGCANVANLLLAKAAGRRREVAIRTALGAGRLRLVRQLLTESVLLGLMGGAAGLLIAYWLTQLMIHFSPGDVPRLAESQLNFPVLAFTLAISLFTGVLFGLAPALQVSKANLNSDLKEGSRGAAAFRRRRVRSVLVVAEVALSLVLLAGAGLLVRSFRQLRDMDAGFASAQVVTFTANPSLSGYTDEQTTRLRAALLARLRQIPGVDSAAASARAVMRGSGVKTTVAPAGQRVDRGDFLNTSFNAVTPDYFDAMGMHIVAGRALADSDSGSRKPAPVVVNQTFARRFFPGENPLGRRFGTGSGVATEAFEIVGVVKDARYRSLREPIPPTYFQLLADGDFVLCVRTHWRPESLIQPVRQALAALDPAMPFTEVRTLAEEVDDSAAPERLTAVLASIFGLFAALLAAVGLYGLLAFAVAQRQREIGIRMALGAQPGAIARLVGGQALVLVAVGVALGLGGALLLAPMAGALLYGVGPADPGSLAAAAGVVALVAALAAFVPAARAARVDPAVALRD